MSMLPFAAWVFFWLRRSNGFPFLSQDAFDDATAAKARRAFSNAKRDAAAASNFWSMTAARRRTSSQSGSHADGTGVTGGVDVGVTDVDEARPARPNGPAARRSR